MTLQNTGNVNASAVEVDAIDAGGATLTPSAPIAVGTIRAGAGVPVNAILTKTGLQPGATYKLSVRGKVQFGSGPSESFTLGGLVRIPVASPGSRAASSATAPAHKTGTGDCLSDSNAQRGWRGKRIEVERSSSSQRNLPAAIETGIEATAGTDRRP